MATNFDTKNTTFAAKLDIDDSMAWPSGRLRGLAMSFFIFCTCIFASTTKTLTCIFYICTHKDIFLIFTHVCNYIYIYTTISIHIYPYMDTFYIYIYTFSIYTYMYLFPRHPTTWDGIFLGFSQTKIWSGRTVHLKGGFARMSRDLIITSPKNQHTVDGPEIGLHNQLIW